MGDEIEQIKERLDLSEVIGEYVQLKRAGHSFKGLCPFHQEKTPSFVVTPDRNIWHCFGCSEGGDVFSFIQKVEGLEFRGALELLAERAGVELKKQKRGEAVRQAEGRQRLFDLLGLTVRFYQELLLRQKVGEKALNYLKERGLKLKTIEEFKLGYAPDQWNLLQRFLVKRGYKLEEMIAAGVVGRSEAGKHYDRFRGRIIFPISDAQGRPVGLGGRIVPWHEKGTEGKYVNSPETDLYKKRRVVFNLDKAKRAIRETGKAIVVEGYMDVIMLAQQGIVNVVASSGTAFTSEQVGQLKRLAQTLAFAFDADAAGWKAALAATEVAQTQGVRVVVLELPEGKDPADVAKETPDKLLEIVDKPVSLARVALDRLGTAGSSEQRQERLNELVPLLAKVGDPVQQGEMIAEVAKDLHLPEEKVGQLVTGYNPGSVVEPEPGQGEGYRLTPEQRVLGLVLAYASARREAWPQFSSEFFIDDNCKELYKVLQRIADNNKDFLSMNTEALVRELPLDWQSMAGSLAVVGAGEGNEQEAVQEARELKRWLVRRSLTRRRDDLQRRLMEVAPDREMVLREFQVVVDQLEKVKS